MKVYGGIEGIQVPEFNVDFDVQQKAEAEYIEKIVAFAEKNGKGNLRGKLVRFPVADGQAQYVIFAPSTLIHLAVGDGWHLPYIERLKPADIRKKVKQQEGLRKLFA